MVKNQEKTSLRDIFLNLICGRVFIFIFGFANSILVARSLGPQGRGYLSLLLTAALFSGLILCPFNNSGTVLIGRNPDKLKTLTYNSLLGAVLAIFLLFCIYAVCPKNLIIGLLGNLPKEWLYLLFGLISFQILTGSLNGLLMGLEEYYFGNYIMLFNYTAVFFLNIVVLLWFRLGVTGAMFVFTLAQFGVFAATFLRLRASKRWNPNSRVFFTPHIMESITMGMRAIAANLAALMIFRSNVFFIKYFLGPAQVGIYAVGINVAEMVLVVGSILNVVIFSRAAAQKNIEESVVRSARFSFFAGLAFFLLVAITGKWIFPLAYGREFAGSLVPCLIVMLGVAVSNFYAPISGYIVGRAGYPVSYLLANFIGLILSIVLNIFLIPVFGLYGAAVSVVLAFLVTGFMLLLIFAKMVKKPVKKILMPDVNDWSFLSGRLSALNRV
jgi:O-antigen/teichoic acid export membrane protein